MGSAALHHLASRNINTGGFDRYAPPHVLGSSHGETRMIREAYYEHPAYVPLVRRAYELWHELSDTNGKADKAKALPLIVETGGVFAGPPDGELVAGIRRSAREHGIAVESLTHADASRRYPWLAFADDMEIVAEPRAGFIYPERCIARHLDQAAQRGATIHPNEPLLSWHADRDGAVVRTSRGEYAADRLILATGAWMVDVLADIGVEAIVERQPLFWFAPRAGAALPRTVWALEFERGRLLYGFPATDAGVKVAIHYGGAQRTTAEEIDRKINEEDSRHLRKYADRHLPGVLGGIARGEICMYTNTPDFHFIFDEHPHHPNVLVVSACSGHGFKFSSAIGNAAAEWASAEKTILDMSHFSLNRFA